MAKVKLQNVRLSFPDLFEPVQYEGQGPFKYRAAFIMEPNSESHKSIKTGVNEVAKEAWPKDWEKVLANANDDSKTRFIVDGDKKSYDGYAGMVVINSTRDQSKGRPLVLDRDKQPLTQTDGKPYAGCYVNATVELWAQNNKFGKCIRAQLLAVQFAKDGDAFGGGSVGSPDEFEDLSDTGEADDLVA